MFRTLVNQKQSLYTGQVILNSITGYLLMKLIAYHFGASVEASIFDLAFSVPFIILSVSGFTFIHGITSSVFAGHSLKNNTEINTLFSTMLNVLLIISAIVVILAVINVDIIANLIAPGFNPTEHEQLKQILLLMFPLTFFFGISTFLGGVFTACYIPIIGEFTLMGARILTISFLMIFGREISICLIAWALVISSFLMLLAESLIFIIIIPIKYSINLNLSQTSFKPVALKSIGFLVVSTVASFNSAYMRSCATLDSNQTVAFLAYTFSIVAPLGVLFGKSFNFAWTAKYSELFNNSKIKSSIFFLIKNVIFAFCFTIILSLLISIFDTTIFSLLYKGGKFDSTMISELTSLVKPLFWSLPPSVILWVMLTPLLLVSKKFIAESIYIGGYVLQIVLNFIFFRYFKADALVWNYTISIWIQATGVILFVIIKLNQLANKSTCEAF